MNFFTKLLFVSLCSCMFFHTTHMVVLHMPKQTKTFGWIHWNYHLLLEEFLLRTVELCSRVEPGVWEEDRGTFFWSRDKLWSNPVCLFALQSQTCWYTVFCLRSWSCSITKVLKKFLIDKNSGAWQISLTLHFLPWGEKFVFHTKVKLHPCLMCFYQSLVFKTFGATIMAQWQKR